MHLVLDLCYYGPGSWSAEVSVQQSGDCVAMATGATADEARAAVLALLTPELLADLRESMISDLAAVAQAMGYTVGRELCVGVDWVMGLHSADDGGSYATCHENRESDERWCLGLALALDTLRRDQEAADG